MQRSCLASPLRTSLSVTSSSAVTGSSSLVIPVVSTHTRFSEGDVKISGDSACMWWGSVSQTVIDIYDVTDRANPMLTKEIKIDGGYFDARMIDEYVYIVATEYTYDIYCALDEKNYTLNVPEISIDEENSTIPPADIYYVDVPELSDTMTHVISINLDTDEVAEKSFMLGSSQTMYVSRNNIFLASAHYPYYPMLYMERTGSSSSASKKPPSCIKSPLTPGTSPTLHKGKSLVIS